MARLPIVLSLVSCLLPGLIAPASAQETTKTTNSIVKEHMEVVGSDKKHVGTVDKYQDTTIDLTKNDPAAGGQHHSIPSSWVGTINGNTVVLNKTAAEAMAQWSDTGRPAADPKK